MAGIEGSAPTVDVSFHGEVASGGIRYTANPITWDDVETSVLRERIDEIVPRPEMYSVHDLWGMSTMPMPTRGFVRPPLPRSRILILTTDEGDYLIDTDGQNRSALVTVIDDDY